MSAALLCVCPGILQYKHEVGALQQKLSGLTREELQRALGVKPMDKSSRCGCGDGCVVAAACWRASSSCRQLKQQVGVCHARTRAHARAHACSKL
jgi:hypothetical protein